MYRIHILQRVGITLVFSVCVCVFICVCVCWSHSTQAAASLQSLLLQHPLISPPPPHILPQSSNRASLSLSSSPSLSEYGPHRLPISLVCRRLQRLLRLADPPGRGQRAAASSSSSSSSSSAAPERQSQRAAAAETPPPTGYPPLCSCSSPLHAGCTHGHLNLPSVQKQQMCSEQIFAQTNFSLILFSFQRRCTVMFVNTSQLSSCLPAPHSLVLSLHRSTCCLSFHLLEWHQSA